MDGTTFVGRKQEVAETRKLLSVSRLVTLTGVGGVGKSRLAVRAAASSRRAFADGVWLVELAGVHDPELVTHSVTQVLGVHDGTGREPLKVLVDYLRDRRLLLVLDNCEHLLDACAELVEAVLPAASGVRVLTTSREPLRATGEHILPVDPLPVPEPCQPLAVEEVRSFAGPALFAERAAGVLEGFEVTANNQAQIVRACRWLDGLPLAIELAAARLRTVSLDALVDGLNDRFGVLTSGDRIGAARHRTLRETVDWSFELCNRGERLVWARASVFAGSFELTAAEHVCAGGEVESAEVLELVAGLVDKSILVAEDTRQGRRYRLLETLRQYGTQQLAGIGDTTVVGRRHRDWYLRLVEWMEREWFGPHQVEWMKRLLADHANLRAALDFCLDTPGELTTGLRLAGALWDYWSARGYIAESRHWLDRALPVAAEVTPERARALWKAGHMAVVQGDQVKGEAMLRQSIVLAKQLDDPITVAYSLQILGVTASFRGDLARAVKLLEEALRRYDEYGQRNCMTVAARVRLASARTFQGEFAEAITLLEECRAICEPIGEQWTLSWTLCGLSRLAQLQGEPAKAIDFALTCLRIKERFQDIAGSALVTEILAWSWASQGQGKRAAVLLGAARQMWLAVGQSWFGSTNYASAFRQCSALARELIGDEAFDASLTKGTTFTYQEALAYAGAGEQAVVSTARKETKHPAALTSREYEVAELVGQGQTNQQIAEKLIITRRTVEGHVTSILSKLGLGSRAQIAAWVAQRRAAGE